MSKIGENVWYSVEGFLWPVKDSVEDSVLNSVLDPIESHIKEIVENGMRRDRRGKIMGCQNLISYIQMFSYITHNAESCSILPLPEEDVIKLAAAAEFPRSVQVLYAKSDE